MEQLKLAQFCNIRTESIKKKREILEKVDVKYCIPDLDIHTQQKISCYSGYTSLHFAVNSHVVDIDLINFLLEQGSNLVKQGTQDGCTPIHVVFNGYFFSHLNKATKLQKNRIINTLLSKQVEIKNISNPKSSTGISHLHIACVRNHFAAVEFFAKTKENVNQCINSNVSELAGYAPLHCAISYSSIEAAEILLQHGADIDLKDAKGTSCLHLLIDRIMRTTDFITMKERRYRVCFEKEIEKNECIIIGFESIIKLVLKARASDEVFMDESGLSALHLSCILQDNSIVKDILKQNVDVNLPVKWESKFWPGWTPLHFAACCNIETMILLMQRGADITIKNSKGETALDLCAKQLASSDFHVILSTKNEFKDIVLSDSCTKLLDLPLVMSDYEKFSDFLQKLTDFNIATPPNSPIWPGYNLLHISVSLNERVERRKSLNRQSRFSEARDDLIAKIKRYNRTEDEEMLHGKRIDLLLEYGCSTSTKNANGQSPIHLGFDTISPYTLKELLRCDQENAVDHNGLTHLHIACALGQLDAVERYVRGGADVNARTGVQQWHDLRLTRAHSTPLHVAVLFRRKSIAEYLLANNADVHATDSMAFTPIHLSTYDFALARLLLDAALPNLRDSVCAVGLSHLHVAAWTGNREAVDRLILGGADIDRVVDKDLEQFPFLAGLAGTTPLHLALGAHHSRAVETLLKAGANIHVKDVDGISALHHAVFDYNRCASSRPLFRMLRECGKSEEVERDSGGMTLLHAACASCDLEWAERLLTQGADVDARVRGGRLDGATPLYVALDRLHVPDDDPTFSPERRCRLVELLVHRGADVSIGCRGSTPLCWLYREVLADDRYCPSNDDFENLFLWNTADLLLRSQKSYRVNPADRHGFSHLHVACVNNDVDTATKFLDHGADVNGSTDPFDDRRAGFTPLHFAMAYKSTEVAYLLLQRGADVNAEDAHGNTPLHVAFKKRFINLPLIEAMIRFGADVRAKNLNDYTLLHDFVTCYDDLPLDEYLNIIERTSMVSCIYQRDVDGNTPLHIAMKYLKLEAMEALFYININSVDLEKEFYINTINLPIGERRMLTENVVELLARYTWKIRFVRLDLTKSNLRFLESMEKQFSIHTLLEQPCQNELTKAKKTEICEGVTVNDFLSELGAAAAYPTMHPIQRAIIDKYFKCTVDLRREFPEFCILLTSQYRKALDRLELMQPAKEAIASLFQVELPNLCSEAVLRYFTNGEVKIVIAR